MDRPTQKKEIVVKILPNNPTIEIWTASSDAYNWIKKEAARFGLYEEPDMPHRRYHFVVVDPNYDLNEIAQWLEQGYMSNS